jgi:NhaP-type Na+/H+ or K+/H+ antiporter
MLSTDQILAGLGLVIVLGLGCELVALRTRLPAIVLLLPVGFLAGALTTDVNPYALFGSAFQPLVSLGVGLILFEAGLRLRLQELGGGVRTVIVRLIPIGTVVTAVGVALTVRVVFGLPWGPAALLGAILIVSGPTVVAPLLEFVRPSERVRSVLKWEGVLIDPIGALLGVIVFTGVKAGAGPGEYHPGTLILDLAVGLAAGAVGAGLLWLLLGGIQRAAPGQSIAVALMVVVGAVVGADLIREDTGFVAATTMGIALANQDVLDVSRVLEFQGRIVQLLIGVLFVMISASVTPSQVSSVLLGALALLAVMVLVIRPLVVALGTWGSELEARERALMAWLAPRGIVAGATASAFGPELAKLGVGGAGKVLPITFVAIFGTVIVYGLTAAPVARRLHVVSVRANVVLVVGGHPWALSIASALKRAGLQVRVWTGRAEEQAAARADGLDAGQGQLGVDLATREIELEGITDALLLTESDDFNALAAFELRQELGHDHVHQLAARGELLNATPGYAQGRTLFDEDISYLELQRRFEAGERAVTLSSDALRRPHAGGTLLFVVSSEGELRVATASDPLQPASGDAAIWLTQPS